MLVLAGSFIATVVALQMKIRNLEEEKVNIKQEKEFIRQDIQHLKENNAKLLHKFDRGVNLIMLVVCAILSYELKFARFKNKG